MNRSQAQHEAEAMTDSLFAPADMPPEKERALSDDELRQRALIGGNAVANTDLAPPTERGFRLPDDFVPSERTQQRAQSGARSPIKED